MNDRSRSTDLARWNRKNPTDAERLLWTRLRKRRLLGLRFRRQQPIGEYIVDFCCLDVRLIVEVDGGQHMERQQMDAIRTGELERIGFRVIRFWNDEVLRDTDQVVCSIEAIASMLQEGRTR